MDWVLSNFGRILKDHHRGRSNGYEMLFYETTLKTHELGQGYRVCVQNDSPCFMWSVSLICRYSELAQVYYDNCKFSTFATWVIVITAMIALNKTSQTYHAADSQTPSSYKMGSQDNAFYFMYKWVKSLRLEWLIAAGAYSGFCSMKRLGVFLLPLDGMLVHRRSLTDWQFISHLKFCWIF